MLAKMAKITFNKIMLHMIQIPTKGLENTCYERQKTWGGMWSYNWRTGTDEHVEIVHKSE